MARKRKALQNNDGDAPSLKAGRPSREYSIEDAVKMVSLIPMQRCKVDMAVRVPFRLRINLSHGFLFFLRKFCTAKIFEGNAQQAPT
jgi:hypothetical protein